MSHFVPRTLDPTEIHILTALLARSQPTTTRWLKKNLVGPHESAHPYHLALSRLMIAGYIQDTQPASKASHRFSVPEPLRPTVRAQLTLGGRVDTFSDETWVMAAFYRSSARCPATAVSAGQGWIYLSKEWGKVVSSKVTFSVLCDHAARGKIVQQQQGSYVSFYATDEQRQAFDEILKYFPSLPNFVEPEVPAPEEVDWDALITQVYTLAVEEGRPRKVREYRDLWGEDAVVALTRLVDAQKMGVVVGWEQNDTLDDDDVVYVIHPAAVPVVPSGLPQPKPATFISSTSMSTEPIPVWELNEDEIAVLRFLMGRAQAVNPFLVSFNVFGDSLFKYLPHDGLAAMQPLRATPVLKSLAEKKLIKGLMNWDGSVPDSCRHDNQSRYTMTPQHKARAAHSLDYNTAVWHCPGCGRGRHENDMLCAKCLAKVNAKLRPKPGAVAIAPEDLPVLHALQAFRDANFRMTIQAAAMFAYTAEAEFMASRACALAHTVTSVLIERVRAALKRLVQDGYITRVRNDRYHLDAGQRTWIHETYPNRGAWPHIQQALASTQPNANIGTARTGRVVELE